MSKTIEEQILLLKESFDSVGTKLNGLTWQRIEKSHLEFSQSQTQELQQQNAELVMTLETIASLITSQTSISTVKTSLLQILSKYNHLKSNTNEN